ncbi:cobyrinic acid a,c-diamide synthase [Methanolinea mesophila]|uniref:cobyrinate a,c-diamide synthase n=1 Tax=Methanolinea mesophila TaxID=547055 RepID=UPI001AE397D9|nr:cobyrinate a,c-diamide synthase [Methanolinea mesophila]MBP1929847.1 cobyrinic acid a,c-diamide synthase [Methanolinea mesophila]
MIAPDRIPRIVIAGTHSGCGKTTIARGLMQVLVERGLSVQPFKVGPDFIDPGFHTAICGRVSRNLDPFMMGENGVRKTFARACAGADIAVIEGVMGMFDGLDGTGFASTAQVMALLSAPGALVVDVKGMSRSAHALVRGYFSYDPGIILGGVIFNRVGSPRHRLLIEAGLETTALGFVRRDRRADLESRHLGLKMAHEVTDHTGVGALVREGCDLDRILALAGSAPPVPGGNRIRYPGGMKKGERIRIGVARDEAFCFYYQDNLDCLAAAGADLIFFSPIRDPLPEVDAVYLGGGYPELHAGALSCAPCTREIRTRAADGLPVYAECGGLLYLCEELVAGPGTSHRMTGILPAAAEMTEGIQGLGYTEGTWTGAGFIPAGLPVKGHEFHYSRIHPSPDARFSIRLTRGRGIFGCLDGLYEHRSVGNYTHSYFSSEFAHSLILAAEDFRRS